MPASGRRHQNGESKMVHKFAIHKSKQKLKKLPSLQALDIHNQQGRAVLPVV